MRWSYKTQGPSIRHMGPTAQDFSRAFGLGEDDRHITTIDADGVALAAIQGLYRQNQALQRQNQALRSQLVAENSRLSRLEHAFSKLSR
jgi:trimeric autotransporter adhesin